MGGFIARPTDLLIDYHRRRGFHLTGSDIELGRISVALELLTVVRLLEGGSLGGEEVISAVRTFLIDQDLLDEGERWYKLLGEWRRPKFVEVETKVRGRDYASRKLPFVEQPRIGPSELASSFEPSFRPLEPESGISPRDSRRERGEVRPPSGLGEGSGTGCDGDAV